MRQDEFVRGAALAPALAKHHASCSYAIYSPLGTYTAVRPMPSELPLPLVFIIFRHSAWGMGILCCLRSAFVFYPRACEGWCALWLHAACRVSPAWGLPFAAQSFLPVHDDAGRCRPTASM